MVRPHHRHMAPPTHTMKPHEEERLKDALVMLGIVLLFVAACIGVALAVLQ